MRAIGIGCFWFARRGGEPDSESAFSPFDHLKDIKDALEGVDNISDVQIEIVSESGSVSISGCSYGDDEEEDKNFYPMYSDGTISFRIYMPKRLHEKYGLGFVRDGVEHLQVVINHDGGMPVTYIHYEVTGGEPQAHIYAPSSSIIVTREYLQEKLKDHPKIDFQFLGPSPFHADFFVNPSKAASGGSIARDLSPPGYRGYRTLFFQFPADDDDDDDLIAKFITEYHPSLSTFYRVVRYRTRALILSSDITEGTRSLIQASSPNWFPAIRRWFRQGPMIDQVFSSILEERMNRAALTEYLAEARSDDAINEDNVLYRFITNTISDVSPTPADDIKDILKLLEDRRQGYIRNSTTLIAGLIGGILGAALTFLLTLHSSP